MKYRIPCRYARFEGGKLIRYPAGSEVELSEAEARKLRAEPVAEGDSPEAPLAPAATVGWWPETGGLAHLSLDSEPEAKPAAEVTRHLGAAHLPADPEPRTLGGPAVFDSELPEDELDAALEVAGQALNDITGNLTRQQALDLVRGLDSASAVEAVLSAERGGRNRTPVIRAAEARLAELTP